MTVGDGATPAPTPGPGPGEVNVISGGDGGSSASLYIASDGSPAVWTPLRIWLELLSLEGSGVRASATPGEIFGPFVAVTDGSGLLAIDVDALVWADGVERGKKASVPAGTWRIRLAGANGSHAESVAGPIVILAATQGDDEREGDGTGGGGCDAMGLGGLAMMALAKAVGSRRKGWS